MKFSVISKNAIYARFLLVMVVMNVIFILASESAFLLNDPENGPRYAAVVIGVLNMFFFFYALRIVMAIGTKKVYLQILWGYFIVGLIASAYVANPFMHVLSDELKPGLYSMFHLFNIGLYVFIALKVLADIFKSRETRSDHIWGAIVVYFLLISVFAEVYEIITLNAPGLLGTVYEMGYPNYIQCAVFSLNNMAGIDSVYPDAHDLMKKLASLQSVIGNLFLIVILGRLLSHPLINK